MHPTCGALHTMDLQWFAAEDEGRTEEPTEQKIRKAREEGKVAKSTDLNGAVVLLFAVIAMGILSRSMFNTMTEAFQFFFLRATQESVLDIFALYRILMQYFARIAIPIIIIAAAGAFLANIIQVGFLFTTKPVVPDFKRIVPHIGRFLQRTLFSAEAGFNVLKSWAKLGIIGVIGVVNVIVRYNIIISTLHAPLGQSTLFLIRLAYSILLQSAIALVVFSLFDYQFQRYKHRESLKMTRQEVKEERKQQEGDPLIRSRLRQRMQTILSGNMLRNVPRADVVITNPTHYAVALEYESSRMSAPTVIAKGADLIAQRIRSVAFDNDIPLIENKALAHSLYYEVEIGDLIPEKFYEAVVAVLAEIYKLRGVSAEAI